MSESLTARPDDQEMQFLLLCLQGRFNPAALVSAGEIVTENEIEWTVLEGIVDRERLAPLLYSIVRDRGLLPDDFESQLRNTYLRYAIHNALQLRNLGFILRQFNEDGLAMIVLKGAALAETVYGNIAVRPMVDLDVLVESQAVNRALNTLKSMSYFPVDPETHPGMITEYENEVLLQKTEDGDVALELHWSLLDSPHYQQIIDIDWFWQSAENAQFGGAPGLVLGDEALLLHLCSHITLHHGGKGLLWQHDIAEVLDQRRADINWNTLLEKAVAYDLVLSMQHAVNLINRNWNLQLSDGILNQLNHLQPSARERQVFNWLTTEDRPVAQRFWTDLASTGSRKRQLHYAWRNLFPTADYMRQRYEIKRPYFLPFYYPYRWLLGIASVFRS